MVTHKRLVYKNYCTKMITVANAFVERSSVALLEEEYTIDQVIQPGKIDAENSGTISAVYSGYHNATRQCVALKYIHLTSKDHNKRELQRKAAMREAETVLRLGQSHHDLFLCCYDVFESADAVVIVFEFCDGGDLLDYVNSAGALTEHEARHVFVQIASALNKCHQMGVAHRDIRLENVYIRGDGTVVLGGFDVARRYSKRQHLYTICGTLRYAAPEMHQPLDQIDVDPEAADVFSLGVLLYLLVVGCFPFDGHHDNAVIAKKCSGRYNKPAYLSTNLRALLDLLLTPDAQQRPSFSKIIKHNWCTTSESSDRSDYSIRATAFSSSLSSSSVASDLASQKNRASPLASVTTNRGTEDRTGAQTPDTKERAVGGANNRKKRKSWLSGLCMLGALAQ